VVTDPQSHKPTDRTDYNTAPQLARSVIMMMMMMMMMIIIRTFVTFVTRNLNSP